METEDIIDLVPDLAIVNGGSGTLTLLPGVGRGFFDDRQPKLLFNLGSAVVLPEVLLKAVSVVRNFGHNLDGLVTVNLDKQVQYRSRVNVLERPSAEGIELIGHHELLLPLLHAATVCQLATVRPLHQPEVQAA